jgi:tRNA(Glu) U13 pseudouridine synthase TruD
VQLGPLFGTGMPPAAGEAAAREAALLAEEGLDEAACARLEGGRRAARVQPGKVVVDCDGGDVVLSCDLALDTWLDTLLAELIRPPQA